MEINIPGFDYKSEVEHNEKKEMKKMLWLITDTHFEHEAMISRCDRPKNFTSLICTNWRQVVKPKDTIIHLGDCAWNETGMKRLLSLPGKKILVRGNHDSQSLEKYMDMGWDFACDSLVMKLYSVTILFSHKPVWGHKADINIHGHFHDLHREDFSRLYLPLSIEAMGYKPIAVNEEFMGSISSWIGKRRIPKLKEIWDLKQNHRPIIARDIYGRLGKDEFVKAFIRHSTENQSYDYNSDLDIDTVLEKYGIDEKMIGYGN